MSNVHHLRNDRLSFTPCPPAVDQERARAGLYALRDMLEAAPPAVSPCDPAGLGALLGMVAESLPVIEDESED